MAAAAAFMRRLTWDSERPKTGAEASASRIASRAFMVGQAGRCADGCHCVGCQSWGLSLGSSDLAPQAFERAPDAFRVGGVVQSGGLVSRADGCGHALEGCELEAVRFGAGREIGGQGFGSRSPTYIRSVRSATLVSGTVRGSSEICSELKNSRTP